MKIKIRTTGFRLSIPVPLGMAGFIIRMIPEHVFLEMNRNIPEPYSGLVTKESVRMILEECLDILKENKGLEVVHVEAADGTFVSIRI